MAFADWRKKISDTNILPALAYKRRFQMFEMIFLNVQFR